MTRLSSVLYQYVLEHSEAFLALMPEYPDCRPLPGSLHHSG